MAMWKNPGEAAGQAIHEGDESRTAPRASDTRRALTLMMNRLAAARPAARGERGRRLAQ
jgi:hypothetical protein